MAQETKPDMGLPDSGEPGLDDDEGARKRSVTIGTCLLDEFDFLHGKVLRERLTARLPQRRLKDRPSDYAQYPSAEARPGDLAFYDVAGDLYVDLVHAMPVADRPTALCLSGGGIRSATFSLGVLQGLAIRQALGRFTYLSSVSGGGYIAAWLANRIRLHGLQNPSPTLARIEKDLQESAATRRPDRFGQPCPLPAVVGPVEGPVARLRAYSNYLSPVMGLSGDMLALAATFLRNLVLNLCVWLSLLVAAALLPRLAVAAMIKLGTGPQDHAYWPWACAGAACLLLAVGLAYIVSDMGDRGTPQPPPAPGLRDWFFGCSFLPAATGALLLAYACLGSEGDWLEQMTCCMGAGAASSAVGVLLGLGWRILRGNSPISEGRGSLMYALIAVLLTSLVGGVLVSLVMSAGRRLAGHEETAALAYITFAFPLLLGCFWVQMTLCAAALRPVTDENDREWWARGSGVWLIAAIAWMAWFGVVLFAAPWVLSMLGATLSPGAQLTGGSALLGIATSAFGYWSKNGDRLKQRAEGFVARLGDKVLEVMAGVVLLAVALMVTIFAAWFTQQTFEKIPLVGAKLTALSEHDRAQVVFLRQEGAQAGAAAAIGVAQDGSASGEMEAYRHGLFNADAAATGAWMLIFGVAAVILSSLMGANTFSLHGMYGNRLVRAYLGAARGRRDPHWFTGFDADDNTPLKNCRPAYSEERRPSLFPVINMTLNLVQARNRTLAWQQRKGAPFMATPRCCGSVRTGYVATFQYGGKKSGMTLGRAMTISGAAASPNMGYHSSTLVTMVMALFNVRLGWWLANPRPEWSKRWKWSEPVNGLQAMLSEAFGRTTDDRAAVYLSDGGHFDNLGLYEMVRRRCHRILVVDAGADPRYEYSDLFSTVRKVRVDLGIRISVPQRLPGQAGFQGWGRMAMARIHYSDRDGGDPDDIDGVLYVLKPLLNGCEPPDLREYAATTSKSKGPFPQQSTVNQFFDETQFESYRALGLHTLLESWVRPGWPRVPDPFDPEGDCSCAPAVPGASGSTGGTGAAPPARGESGGAETASGGGLAGLVRHVGPGVALAAAVTVGGTIGVVGTSHLGPTETHPLPTEQTTVTTGFPPAASAPASAASTGIVISDSPAPSPPPVAAPIDTGNARITIDLSRFADGAASSVEAAAANARAARISAEAATSTAASMTTAAGQLNTKVGEVAEAIGRLGPPDRAASDSATLLGKLDQLNTNVTTLTARVQALQPRRVSPSQ